MEDTQALATLRESMKKNLLLLEKEATDWEGRRQELLSNIVQDEGKVREASVPVGFCVVETPKHASVCGYNTGGVFYLAVKEGVKLLLPINPYYHTIDTILGVPENELVYFWDTKRRAWRVLFQSDGTKGGMHWCGVMAGWTPQR